MHPGQIEVNEVTGYWTFLLSIDWKDPWLICLVLAHVLTTTTALLSRNNSNFQVFLFLILLLAVYFTESINEYAAQNWSSFSRQQYFDSNGLFISTVFSIPILLNCMLLIGTWLYNSTQLMVSLKTAQLKERARQERQKTADTSDATTHAKVE
ncbi:transmembrane protein 18 [Drosophila bipectinata]|uniref:transmembrane protein 18 n=1 Tax=Drosophila bipectinata TaxID=42026 RepID=UPI0007E81FEA|nr:transmembrane protein 18 [Drosophila bipectinata]